MNRFFRQLFSRRPQSVRSRTSGFRPGLEALEMRNLMAVGSTPYAQMIESADFGNTVAAAQKQPAVPIVPMMLTSVIGKLPKGDAYK
jgi:hypothetical protein